MTRVPQPSNLVAVGRKLHLHEERLALRLMALGFGIGSALFATGAVLSVVGAAVANSVFVVGAWCFTAAATVQWRTAVHHSERRLRRRAELDLASPDWQSAVIQLFGTLEFNVMTTKALTVSLSNPTTYNTEVWRPDVFGSIAFLLSSAIALRPITRLRRHAIIPRRSMAIAQSSMAGSILFAVSAVAALAESPEELRNALWNNAGTFLGSLGFLVAAVLTWPPRTSKGQPKPPSISPEPPGSQSPERSPST